MSNITQIPTINIHVTENSALQFHNYKCVQLKLTNRLFTKCINLCDIGENFCDAKKPTINLLPEHQYRSNSKLRIREILWKISGEETYEKSSLEIS